MYLKKINNQKNPDVYATHSTQPKDGAKLRSVLFVWRLVLSLQLR